MNIILEKVAEVQKDTLKQLLELYSYDFTRVVDADVGEDGRYNYPLDQLGYFKNPERFAYFIRLEKHLAGFVLLRKENDTYYMNEFFVLYKYRNQGIGKEIAYKLFDTHKGLWIVNQSDRNLPAHEFWHKVIREYANNSIQEIQENGRRILSFKSREHSV